MSSWYLPHSLYSRSWCFQWQGKPNSRVSLIVWVAPVSYFCNSWCSLFARWPSTRIKCAACLNHNTAMALSSRKAAIGIDLMYWPYTIHQVLGTSKTFPFNWYLILVYYWIASTCCTTASSRAQSYQSAAPCHAFLPFQAWVNHWINVFHMVQQVWNRAAYLGPACSLCHQPCSQSYKLCVSVILNWPLAVRYY